METDSDSSQSDDDGPQPAMTLGELARNLRRAPRMYLPDDRYASAVAFIDGFDTGQAGAALMGFREFLA